MPELIEAKATSLLRDRARACIAACPALPLPGAGHTLARWRTLAGWAAEDLCLIKILEAHFDALAILQELGHECPAADQLWAVWAAEPPGVPLEYTEFTEGRGLLQGTKAWCSGADFVTHALVTARTGELRQLVEVGLGESSISEPAKSWCAVGMQRVVSGSLTFDSTVARRVGEPGEYLSRPGFWHGGAGIAACWLGGASGVAEKLRTSPRIRTDPHAAAHLGAIDMMLSAAAALLREVAERIDQDPRKPHVHEVVRARSLVERVATEVIDRVGRALGAGPLCMDQDHARRCADLATFLRQSHAEQDWATVGTAAQAEGAAWKL